MEGGGVLPFPVEEVEEKDILAIIQRRLGGSWVWRQVCAGAGGVSWWWLGGDVMVPATIPQKALKRSHSTPTIPASLRGFLSRPQVLLSLDPLMAQLIR